MKKFWEGLFAQNPVFVLLLGLVPAVAVTSTARGGLTLGLTTGAVLIVSALGSSILSPFLPKESQPLIRLGLVIVCTVLAHSLLLHIAPAIVAELGIFLPLLAVNSMIVDFHCRAMSPVAMIFDACGKAFGFAGALLLIGVVREILAGGTVFGAQVFALSRPPLALAGTIPGGMIVVGLLLALAQKLTGRGGEVHD